LNPDFNPAIETSPQKTGRKNDPEENHKTTPAGRRPGPVTESKLINRSKFQTGLNIKLWISLWIEVHINSRTQPRPKQNIDITSQLVTSHEKFSGTEYPAYTRLNERVLFSPMGGDGLPKHLPESLRVPECCRFCETNFQTTAEPQKQKMRERLLQSPYVLQ
jgi:hypothetical protein